jgi:AcrR family transcriptional regulator
MLRERIMGAMVATVAQRGFQQTTIGSVCARAQVSRATFYDVFDGLQDCFLVVIDDGYHRAHALITQAFEGQECWRTGIRDALAALLSLFDEEPLLARVWFLETLAAGSWALERRGHHVHVLLGMITERWPLPDQAQITPLASTAVFEAILGILQTRILTGNQEPLVELLGPLMGLISSIYLDPSTAASETQRAQKQAEAILARRQTPRPVPESALEIEVPAMLRNPRAHRARACLRYLAENPGGSNREIATAIDIVRSAQISKLLARLSTQGLLTKHPGPPGGTNAWTLTPHGTKINQALEHPSHFPSTLSPTGLQSTLSR